MIVLCCSVGRVFEYVDGSGVVLVYLDGKEHAVRYEYMRIAQGGSGSTPTCPVSAGSCV